MKNVNRPKVWRSVRPTSWPAASTVAAVAAVFATIVAGPGAAAPAINTGSALHSSTQSDFKEPKLRHGVLRVHGTEASDRIALRLQAGDPSILQVDVGDDGSADFSFARSEISEIDVDARPGDDLVRIDDSNGRATENVATTLDGGAGDDTVAGGAGAETLQGGSGNDVIDGNGGADIALMGAGDDTFVWDPGDGSDVVEGQDGADTMRFNGAGGGEQVDLSANGNRLRFFRTQGTITMDTAGVERVDFNALGGADLATVNDLSGTDVGDVRIDLAATLGGVTGDGQNDRVVVNATNGDDVIDVRGDVAAVKVSGLSAAVTALHSEAANDQLELNTLGGTDTVDSAGLVAGTIQLLVDGIPAP
jgi:Ca2+-binding RTX toxin-like protein